MKKFTLISIIFFVLFISIPAFAGHNEGCPQNNPNCNNDDGERGAVKNTNTNDNRNENKNTNINTNLNTNTNEQGQAQGQAQKNELTIIEAETKRDHHTGTPVTFASLGEYKESVKTSSRFQTAKTITMFKDTFSYEGALKRYWKGACKTIGSGYNGVHKDDPSKEVKAFDLSDKIIPGSVKSIGFLTIIANEGEGVSSFVVMQRAIILTAERQGDAFVVTKEGEETVTKSSGWGVGFNTTSSVINDMDNRGRSGSASGGTGYSSGKGSLERLPWMKIQILKFK